MTRQQWGWLALGSVLGLTGCWATPVTIETRSVAPETPESRGSGSSTAAQQPAEPDHVTVVLTPDDQLFEPPFAFPPPLHAVLPGGLTTVVRGDPDAARDTALLRLTVPVGGQSGSKNGLAELAAWAVVDVPSAAASTPSVRAAIESLGGEIYVRVGSRSTSFDIVAPATNWLPALQALITALVAPPEGNDQIVSVQGRLTRDLRRELSQASIDNLVRLITTAEGQMPGRFVDQLEDLIPEEVTLFQRYAYRAAGSVLALWVPGSDTAGALSVAKDAVAPWAGTDASAERPSAPPPPAMGAGVFWAPSTDTTCRTAFVIPVPHLAEPLAIERRVLLECLSMNGVGGRLGRATGVLAPFGLALRSSQHWNGASRYLILRTTTRPPQIAPLWDAQMLARASLRRAPPSPEEIAAAAARVKLQVLAEYADPWTWIEAATAEVLCTGAPADIADVLSQLDNCPQLAIDSAAGEIAAGRIAQVVVGGQPPATSGLRISGLPEAFIGPAPAEVPLDIAEQIEAAEPYMKAAIHALGGERKLVALVGFSGALTRHSTTGAAAVEQVWFLAPDRCRRERQVLATTIETVVGPDGSFERAGAERLPLDSDEAGNLLAEVKRHPLMLLAANARRGVIFRLVSLRTAGDRDVAIVERVDASQPQLRLMIDVVSGLVRRVETREWRPELQSRIHITEDWSDYRPVSGMRAPFYCLVTFDETDAVSVAWKSVTLSPPSVQQVQ